MDRVNVTGQTDTDLFQGTHGDMVQEESKHFQKEDFYAQQEIAERKGNVFSVFLALMLIFIDIHRCIKSHIQSNIFVCPTLPISSLKGHHVYSDMCIH